MALSEVALTLSQCRGFSFGFDASISSASFLSAELAPLFSSSAGFIFMISDSALGVGLLDCMFVNFCKAIVGTLNSDDHNFCGLDSGGGCGGGGGGGGGGIGFLDVCCDWLSTE